YVEQQPLFNLGQGLTGSAAVAAGHQRSSTPLPLFNCPSRRAAQQYPLVYSSPLGTEYRNWPGQLLKTAGRTDYGSVGGNQSNSAEFNDGPTVEEAATPASLEAYWSTGRGRNWNQLPRFNGVIYARSQTRLTELRRGTSNTLLLGDKYLPTDRYTTGTDPGDNECMYTGLNNDISRSTFDPPLQDQPGPPALPLPTRHTSRFRSAHPGGFNVALADGSVRVVTYAVNIDVWRVYGDRTSTSPLTLD